MLLALAITAAFFKLRDDIAAIVEGRVPQAIVNANQPVNYVHVLDLMLLLPAWCMTAIRFRRKAPGYAFAPIFLTLLAIMSIELVRIMTVMGRLVFGISYPTIVFFAVLGVGFTGLLWRYFSVKKGEARLELPVDEDVGMLTR